MASVSASESRELFLWVVLSVVGSQGHSRSIDLGGFFAESTERSTGFSISPALNHVFLHTSFHRLCLRQLAFYHDPPRVESCRFVSAGTVPRKTHRGPVPRVVGLPLCCLPVTLVVLGRGAAVYAGRGGAVYSFHVITFSSFFCFRSRMTGTE